MTLSTATKRRIGPWLDSLSPSTRYQPPEVTKTDGDLLTFMQNRIYFIAVRREETVLVFSAVLRSIYLWNLARTFDRQKTVLYSHKKYSCHRTRQEPASIRSKKPSNLRIDDVLKLFTKLVVTMHYGQSDNRPAHFVIECAFLRLFQLLRELMNISGKDFN